MPPVTYSDLFQRQRLWQYGEGGVVPNWLLVGDWQLPPDASVYNTGVVPPLTAAYSGYLKPTGTADAKAFGKCREATGIGGDPHPRLGENQGVVVRWVDDAHWLALVVIGDHVELQQRDGGAPAALFSSPASGAPITQLSLEVEGSGAIITVFRHSPMSSNYLDVKKRVTLPDGPVGHLHGLISYNNADRFERVEVTVEEDKAVVVLDTTTTKESLPVTTIDLAPPPGLVRNDYLIALVASRSVDALPPPVGWQVLGDVFITEFLEEEDEVHLVALGAWWHPDRVLGWTVTSAMPSPLLASVTLFRRVDRAAPIIAAGTGTAYMVLQGEFAGSPRWQFNRGQSYEPHSIQYDAMAVVGGYTTGRYADPKQLGFAYQSQGDLVRYAWDDWTVDDDPLTAFAWWSREWIENRVDLDPDPTAWVSLQVELRGAIPLPTEQSTAVSPMMRLRSTQNYIGAVLADDPIAFWPLDEPPEEHSLLLPMAALTDTLPFTVGSHPLTYYVGENEITNRGGASAANTQVVHVENHSLRSAGTPDGSGVPGSYTPSDDFTIEVWARCNTGGAVGSYGFVWNSSTIQDDIYHGWAIVLNEYDSGEAWMRYYHWGLPAEMVFGSLPAADELVHYAAVHEGGSGTRLFVNGEMVVDFVPDGVGYPTQPSGFTNYPSPDIPDVATPAPIHVYGNLEPGFLAIYQEALAPERIERHYRAGTGPTLSTIRTRAHCGSIAEPHYPELDTSRLYAHQEHMTTAPPHRPGLSLTHTLSHPGTVTGSHRSSLAVVRTGAHPRSFLILDRAVPAEVGEIVRVVSWSGRFDGPINIPFRLLVGDWLVVTCDHLAGVGSGSGGPVALGGFRVREAHSSVVWDSFSTFGDAHFYEVVDVTGGPTLSSDPDFHVMVSMVVYRGAELLYDTKESTFFWTGVAEEARFESTLPGIDFTRRGLVIRALHLQAPPSLFPIEPAPSEAGIVQTFTVDPEDLDHYDSQLTVIIHEEPNKASPAVAWEMHSNTPWDYGSYSWMDFVFRCRAAIGVLIPPLRELHTDPSNASPVGSGTSPIGGARDNTDIIDGITDEHGDVLVDENGNILIFE